MSGCTLPFAPPPSPVAGPGRSNFRSLDETTFLLPPAIYNVDTNHSPIHHDCLSQINSLANCKSCFSLALVVYGFLQATLITISSAFWFQNILESVSFFFAFNNYHLSRKANIFKYPVCRIVSIKNSQLYFIIIFTLLLLNPLWSHFLIIKNWSHGVHTFVGYHFCIFESFNFSVIILGLFLEL